jgi:hypothetical protein
MKRFSYIFLLAGLVGALACGGASEESTDGNNGKGGKADENGGEFPCEVKHFSGGAIDLSQRTDVLAELVLKTGEGCPKSFEETMEKLRKTDTGNCSVENRSAGINTMVVSETAQLLGEPTDYRVVTTRKCGERKKEDLFFSLFGVRPAEKNADGELKSRLPIAAEVIAFDETRQEYVYYEITGSGEWEFFGTSTDILNGTAGRCQACHTGGGPIMKELDTPWLHWEGHEDVPGARDLVDSSDDLGSKSSGSAMERLTKDSNRKWNKTRVELLKSTGDTARLLEPLFCTVEINVDNGTDFANKEMKGVKLDFMIDPQFGNSGTIPVDHADYVALLDEFEQFVELSPGDNAKDSEGKEIRDTIFLFAYPERSFNDDDYVEKLKDAGIVDDEFIKDVLAVDFTNPIWSDSRCGLLEFAPELEEFTPETLRVGFLAKLEGAEDGTPAGQLRANLEEKENEQAHDDAVKAFKDACKARDKREFLEDTLFIVTARREQARALPVFEFHPALPMSTFNVDPGVHLDAVTCELVQPE